MKIVFINNLYKPYVRGGAEKVVEQRALKALEQNNEVTIITLAKNKSEHNQVFWDGKIKIIRIYPKNIFTYFDLNKHGYLTKLIWHFIDIFGCARYLQQILLSEKPEVVETHNLMGVGVYKIYKVLKSIKSGIKWNHYLHDVQLVEPSGVLSWDHKRDNILQKIYAGIMKRNFRNVDQVISPSKFLQEFYKERRFFQSSEFIVLSSQSAIVEQKKINSNKTFLFVGSLVEHKGVKVLMKVWDEICSNYSRHSRESGNPTPQKDSSFRGNDVWKDSHFFLNIVGDGELRREVKEWAKNKKNVQVFGRLEGDKLENVYQQSDVLIMPSVCLENCPTVILEAQKYGLQIIASDTGGVRELVSEESLFEPGNVEELVNKITLISQI